MTTTNLTTATGLPKRVSAAVTHKREYKIPYMLFRGGTSQGPIVLNIYLPHDPIQKDQVILKLMGAPHNTQIDGIGGHHPLKNKLCTVNVSKKPNVDIEYCVQQVYRDSNQVDRSIDCGNMLSAVASFAIENNLVKAAHPTTKIRIFNQNTNSYSEAHIPTPNGHINYSGDTCIDGVDGTGAPILLSFLKPGGSTTTKILPTNNAIDIINGIRVSCVDSGMPMVIVCANDFNKTGYESKVELDSDHQFMQQLESIRRSAAILMGFGDVSNKVMPKICLIAKSTLGDDHIVARYMIDPSRKECHPTFAITALVCLSSACCIEGTLAFSMVNFLADSTKRAIVIEHPLGTIEASVELSMMPSFDIERVSYVRTARKLSTAVAHLAIDVPQHIIKLFRLQQVLRKYIHKYPKFAALDRVIGVLQSGNYAAVERLINYIESEVTTRYDI